MRDNEVGRAGQIAVQRRPHLLRRPALARGIEIVGIDQARIDALARLGQPNGMAGVERTVAHGQRVQAAQEGRQRVDHDGTQRGVRFQHRGRRCAWQGRQQQPCLLRVCHAGELHHGRHGQVGRQPAQPHQFIGEVGGGATPAVLQVQVRRSALAPQPVDGSVRLTDAVARPLISGHGGAQAGGHGCRHSRLQRVGGAHRSIPVARASPS